jgi:hypothetical protein
MLVIRVPATAIMSADGSERLVSGFDSVEPAN